MRRRDLLKRLPAAPFVIAGAVQAAPIVVKGAIASIPRMMPLRPNYSSLVEIEDDSTWMMQAFERAVARLPKPEGLPPEVGDEITVASVRAAAQWEIYTQNVYKLAADWDVPQETADNILRLLRQVD